MTQKQTLLFSATIPPGLTGVMEKTMRNGSATVDCIHDDDGATHSVDQVPQSHVLLPDNGRQVSGVIEIVENAMASAPSNHKVLFLLQNLHFLLKNGFISYCRMLISLF